MNPARCTLLLSLSLSPSPQYPVDMFALLSILPYKSQVTQIIVCFYLPFSTTAMYITCDLKDDRSRRYAISMQTRSNLSLHLNRCRIFGEFSRSAAVFYCHFTRRSCQCSSFCISLKCDASLSIGSFLVFSLLLPTLIHPVSVPRH